MAIWDKVETEASVLSADSNKCMGCGGNLVFDIKTNSLKCNSCGATWFPEAFEVRKLISRSERTKKTADSSDFYEVNDEIVCNACGSVVIAGKNTISTRCTFCGSPALVTRRVTDEYRPDYIIPFVFERDDAEKKFKEWLEDKKYLPRDFTKKMTMTGLTPMYVPFWLVDADCVIDFDANGTVEGPSNVLEFYNCKRKGMFKMHNVPFDGSVKIRDDLMEKIEPFDYTSVAPYSDGYLQGFYAEKYDLSANDMAERIANRFRDFMSDQNDAYAVNCNDNKVHYSKFVVEENRSEAKNLKCKYALLPVWFSRVEYKGLYYSVAINGQTGKIAGHMPVSDFRSAAEYRRKKFLYVARFFGTIFAATALVTGPFLFFPIYFTSNRLNPMAISLMWMSAVTLFAVALTAGNTSTFAEGSSLKLARLYEKHVTNKLKVTKEEIQEADTRPPAYVYMDSSEKVEMEGTDVMDAAAVRYFSQEERDNTRGML